MAVTSMLAALAGIFMSADLAVVTSPSFDNLVGVPKLESAMFVPLSQKDSRAPVQFRSAKVSEVLSWLESHGYNFVVTDGDIPSGKTVTLSATGLPVSSVADAIANALGGHWEESGGIHVFKKGTSMLNWMKVPSEGNFIWQDGMPGFKSKDQDLQKLFGPDLQKQMQGQFGPEFEKKMKDQFRPDFQKKMQGQFGPDFEKKMKDAFGPEFQKKLRDEIAKEQGKKPGNQFGPDFEKKIQEQFGPEFQKKMHDTFGEKFQKQMQDQFGGKFQKQMQDNAGKNFDWKTQDQFGEKFQKQMQDNFGPEFQKKMQDLGQKMKEQMAKNKELGKEWAKEWTNGNQGQNNFFFRSDSGKTPGNHKSDFSLGHFDAQKFLNSLTSNEKDQQRKQGYVWFNDLTREQKSMFDQFDGKFDIDLKVNGEEIRVRRN